MTSCLIVDDSKVIRAITLRILEALRFEIREAGDGVEALAACRQRMPDLVLLDRHMPAMDGLAFLKALRTLPGGGHPIVIVCTADTDIEAIREALAAGADEYIMKPFDGDIVCGKLAQFGLA